MNSRERVRLAIERRQPDRVPLWCPLSTGHLVRNGMPDGRCPETTEECVQAQVDLVHRYGFDGICLSLPFAAKGQSIKSWFKMGDEPPTPDYSHNFEETDPESWPRFSEEMNPEHFHNSRLARELLGPDYHLGGWFADGFSKAIQWFPTMEEALMAMQIDPERFAALVRYFDDLCAATVKAQIRLGAAESIQISSPYAGSSFISLDMYKRFVLPAVKSMADAIREAGGWSYVHTCGFINDRLELIADAGVDGIECMDPAPLGNVSLADAKRRVGDRVFLKGNLDSVNLLLRASDEEVDRMVRECLDAAMAGGGYILSTACSVAPDVSPRRMRRLYDLLEEYGYYR